MKIYTTAYAGPLRASRLVAEGQKRWVSYEKSALTKENLVRQLESGLGEDADGNPIKIDPEKKTIRTASGSLPVSPLMDPAWMKARRRQKKAAPTKVSGQFRRKLTNNPYAEALITPLRWCKNTGTFLPRYFLQDFELVQHPDPEQTNPWFAPGPLSFNNVKPWSVPDTTETDADTSSTDADLAQDKATPRERFRQAPLTGYILARKATIDILGIRQGRSYIAKLSAQRSGMVNPSGGGNVSLRVWRPDMGDYLLKLLRREAVDALVLRATRETDQSPSKFIQPVASWDEAKGKKLVGGCVLWIPKESKGQAAGYATLDVEDANYGAKMAVHDLVYLLGEEEVQRLRDEAELFRDQEFLVLRPWRSKSMRSLHLLLWRLQGYLAEPKAAPEAAPDDAAQEEP
ncbi:hypothetical protein F66182_2804 [Fusarium sp. NRRL 66182]|nr:hypothetical protein F66182_2804 [Fusarium sp. NRRL 66182]